MSRTNGLAVLAALVGIGFAATAPAGVRIDGYLDLASREFAKSPLFDAVGKLSGNGAGGELRGAGTLISPEWVLTAARVVDDTAAADLTFQLGGQDHAASQIVLHPGWESSGRDDLAGHDLALIRLAEPINRVGPLSIGVPAGASEVGQIVSIVGFGATGVGSTGVAVDDGLKRAGQNVVDAVGSPLFVPELATSHDRLLHVDFDNPTNLLDGPLGSPFPLSLEYLPAPNDDGAAAIAFFGDELRLIGIGSFVTALDGTVDADYGDLASLTRVEEFVGFIEATTQVDFTAPDAAGDFNGDDVVDIADYQLWQSQFGLQQFDAAADANRDGVVDAADYTVWRDAAAAATASGGLSPTPSRPRGFCFSRFAGRGCSGGRIGVVRGARLPQRRHGHGLR